MEKRAAIFLYLLLAISTMLIACSPQNIDGTTTAPVGSSSSQSGGGSQAGDPIQDPDSNVDPNGSAPGFSEPEDAPVVSDDREILYGTWTTKIDKQQIQWIFVNNGDFAQVVIENGVITRVMKGIYYVENGQIFTGSGWDAEIHGVDYVLIDRNLEIAGQVFIKESDSMVIPERIPSEGAGENNTSGNPYASSPNGNNSATSDTGEKVPPTEGSHGTNPGQTRPNKE